jgi:hypothetical protein
MFSKVGSGSGQKLSGSATLPSCDKEKITKDFGHCVECPVPLTQKLKFSNTVMTVAQTES